MIHEKLDHLFYLFFILTWKNSEKTTEYKKRFAVYTMYNDLLKL